MSEWYKDWFNQDYLNLYAYRDEEEAASQVDFIANTLPLNGRERILDLGCGTGRHSLFFALKGMDVIGIDASEIMIDYAKKYLNEHPHLLLHFYLEDMRNIKQFGIFDLIVSMFTSFGYFETDVENEKVIQNVSACLKEGGHFFLDYLHPDKVRRTHIPFEEKQIEHQRVKIYKTIEGNVAIKKICFPNNTYTEKVCLYSRLELEDILVRNNLEPIHVYNDYHGSPWKVNGDRQIFVCKKNA